MSDPGLSDQAKWLITKFMAATIVGGWAIVAAIGFVIADSSKKVAIADAQTKAAEQVAKLLESRQRELDGLKKRADELLSATLESSVKAQDAVEDAKKVRDEYGRLDLELPKAEATLEFINKLRETPEEFASLISTNNKFLEIVGNRITEYPVGTIVAYWGTEAPRGWFLCNDTPIPKKAVYAKLRGMVGDSTPDLRGMFLRGLDAKGLKVSGEKGRSLGALQDDSFENHRHYLFADQVITDSRGFSPDRVHPAIERTTGRGHTYRITGSSKNADHGLSGVPVGSSTESGHSSFDDETRPVNVAVNFIIKY